MSNLLDYLVIASHTDGNCEWFEVELLDEHFDEAVELIANIIAEVRFGSKSSDKYIQWKKVYRNETVNDAITKEIFISYLAQSIGKPGDSTPDDNLQAVVAEAVCYEISRCKDTKYGKPVRTEQPKFIVTDSGGDGLSVYKQNTGYMFRLWESKKHATSNSATSKLGTAATQLRAEGTRYLAQMSIADQNIQFEDIELAQFYGKLTELWIKRSDKSNAGIQVTKNKAAYISNSPVAEVKKILDDMHSENQIEVISLSVPDLKNLGIKVREAIWMGI